MSTFTWGARRARGRVTRGGRGRRADRIAAAVVLGLALAVALPGAALAAPGDLDPTFGGGDGMVTTDLGASEAAADVAVQPDGKIVAVGGDTTDFFGNFAAVRYNADGSLDTTFGDGGKVSTDIAGGSDTANGVALQADGKIVVVGTSENLEGGVAWFTVVRYNPDGTLDTTFDGDGKAVTDFGGGGADQGSDVAVQADGKIVAAGGVGGLFALARYNALDGSLDTTFDGDGKVLTSFAGIQGGGTAYGLALQADGRIIAAGEMTEGLVRDFALARYNANGTLDTSFSGDGRVTTDLGSMDTAQDVMVQSDGRIVAVGGSSPGVFSLARYHADGTLDTTFDGDGRVTTNLGGPQGGSSAYDVVQQSDGKLVAVGGGNGDFALARYLTDGSLDTGFGGGDGTVATNFGGADLAHSVALLPDGRLVAAGGGGAAEDFALARYEGGGTTPPPPPGADLAVTVSGPAAVSIGDQATYTVTVRNTSATVPATAVTLADTLTGAGGTVLSAAPSQGSCTNTATSASCTLGTLAAGASATVTVVTEPRSTGTLSDTATADAAETDPVPGNDRATANTTVNNARGCTIIGTSGADTLNGGYFTDVICGLGGNDTLRPGYGNDTVHGGAGNDNIDGSFGDDTLNGGTGNDTLLGNYGNDRLNTVDAVAGNDTANGGFGSDTCTTDPGDTRISCP
ncbi:calcium-binding protein [Streptomyces sp. MB09-01]|uniref:calcium-binding protein n=1 Tax=Streptomyces sp. MB09-01 TaxID=3028666 RepID=UPI0029BCBBE2|nr:calcium-binding protein [Streptomyces sp. MB09-01]MDX3539480.1 calcium-binding protein [Streptomyces sp. MB09-01]